MRRVAVVAALALAAAIFIPAAGPVSAQGNDVLVSNGSPVGPFAPNKQNEPALAVDAKHPNIMAAGSNDNIDVEQCNAAEDNTCPFTEGVGVSGVYLSTDSGKSWTQPTYTGLSARDCVGQPGDNDPECDPQTGPIGTLPNYDTNGLASGGDPALAFGPTPDANGNFSWSNGSRLYYANLAANCGESCGTGAAFKGFEAVYASYTDDIAGAIAGNNSSWSDPKLVTKQSSTLFSDKEQIWADNAASSSHFGNVYVCNAAYRSQEKGNALPQPLIVSTSSDGGNTWSSKQVTNAATNTHSPHGFGKSGCTVRTDSDGVVYVFYYQFAVGEPGHGKQMMVKSYNGGHNFTRPQKVADATDLCNYFEVSIGRCVEDGVAGARDDLSPDPSVDIANAAPSGVGATNQIVNTWVDGRDGLNHEHVMFTTSTDGGQSWSNERRIESAGDRGYYSAPAISPNGKKVYVVYNAWTERFKNDTRGPQNDRPLVGVVKEASVRSNGSIRAFHEIHRGDSGDARSSSQNNLAAEFLGDYVYAVATNTYGAAVWNDVRNGADCPAIDRYRQKLHNYVANGGKPAEAEEPGGGEGGEDQQASGDSTAPTAPDVEQKCPLAFGNSDIYGFSTAP